MPYLPFDSNLDDDQKKASQGQATNPDGSVNISGQSSTISGATNPNANAQPQGKSGSYANINEYLDANKDNSVSMGNNIAGTISNAGNTVKSDIGNTQQDFNNQVDKGTLTNLANANQDVDSTVNQAKSATADKQVNADQVGRFKDISTANYAGPTDLSAASNYGQTYKDLSTADQYKNNAQTDAGRYTLLQQVFNSPTYSQGQQNLDNALIVGNDQARSSIANAGQGLNDLDSNWTQTQADAKQTAADRKTQVDTARQYAQDQLTGARTQDNAAVDASLADTQSHWADQYNQYANLLNGYKGGELDVTADQAKALGINDGQKVYNSLFSTPQNLLDLQAFDPNKVVSKDQVAQLSALDQLANQFGATSIAKYTDPTQAGSLNLNNNFQANRVGSSINQAGTDFNNFATSDNLSGHGDASRDIMASGGDGSFFNPSWSIKQGTANASKDATANLAKYLQDNKMGLGGTATYDVSPGAGVGSYVNPGFGAGPQGEANAAAANIAVQNLYQEILSTLVNQGYNNSVKIKG